MSIALLLAQGLLLAVLIAAILWVRLLVFQMQEAITTVRQERELIRRRPSHALIVPEVAGDDAPDA